MRVPKRILLAMAALAGCGPFAPSGPADPKLAAFIPADTVALAGIRVTELKQTPLYSQVEPLLGRVARDGFDPRRDVEEVLVAFDGKTTVAMARGRFDVKQLEELPRFEHRGVPLYGNQEGAVARIDERTVVAGATSAVRAAIDAQKSGRRAGTDLLAQARALPTPNQVWMVSKGSPSFVALPGGPNTGMLSKMVQSMSDLEFHADFREGIFSALSGECANEADAKFLGDTVRGLVGLARLNLPRNEPQLTKLLDAVAVTQSNRTLTVTLKVPPEAAAQAMERLRSFSREMVRPESTPRPR